MDVHGICTVADCSKPVSRKAYCEIHYMRWWRHGDPLVNNRPKVKNQKCSIGGCESKSINSRGWCSMHYQRWQRTGDPTHSRINREQTGKPCKANGCKKPSGFKGYCSFHHQRWSRTGDPQRASLSDRHKCRETWLEEHKKYEGEDCLIWPFSVSHHGRGQATINGQGMSAPRAMCLLAHGEPPTDEHQAAHSCGNGHLGCMSPKHLRWATVQENEADKIQHGTLRRGEQINTAKLTREKVLFIRANPNISGVDLANMFKVTPAAISSIRGRKNWAWV